ncbi:MAG: FAD-binding protein, partial [Alphaproteobacteria bacterium]|nr:FAD-binding protein [Alphaproteobacteria bacterium]
MQVDVLPTDATTRETVLGILKQRFGDQLTTSDAIRERHGKDESYHASIPPDAVFFAKSTDQVVDAVKTCAEYKFPVIPYGVGTCLEGHIAALHGGLCIDVSEMNAVLEVNPEDLDVTVQPGVTRKQLNEYLR